MAPICISCVHPKHEEIDQKLINYVPATEVAIEYGLTPDAVRRHFNNHVQAQLRKERATLTRAESYLAETRLEAVTQGLVGVLQRVQQIADDAENRSDHNISLKALDQMNKTLMSIAKIVGVDSSSVAMTNEAPELAEARTLIRALKTVLPSYPACAGDIVSELKSEGHFELASNLELFVTRHV
jgi:hypothetical protein